MKRKHTDTKETKASKHFKKTSVEDTLKLIKNECNRYGWFPLPVLNDLKRKLPPDSLRDTQISENSKTALCSDLVRSFDVSEKRYYRDIFRSIIYLMTKDLYGKQLSKEQQRTGLTSLHPSQNELLQHFEEWFGFPILGSKIQWNADHLARFERELDALESKGVEEREQDAPVFKVGMDDGIVIELDRKRQHAERKEPKVLLPPLIHLRSDQKYLIVRRLPEAERIHNMVKEVMTDNLKEMAASTKKQKCELLYATDGKKKKCDPRLVDNVIGQGAWGYVYTPADPECQAFCRDKPCVIKKGDRNPSTLAKLARSLDKNPKLDLIPRIRGVWKCDPIGKSDEIAENYVIMDEIKGQTLAKFLGKHNKKKACKVLRNLLQKTRLFNEMGWTYSDSHNNNFIVDRNDHGWRVDLDSISEIDPKDESEYNSLDETDWQSYCPRLQKEED